MTSPEDGLFPLIGGTIPGVIDSSQRGRLLQSPSTILCFATFDALTARVSSGKGPNGEASSESHTATNHPGRKSLSDGKRIVIETDINTGICTWRFVPRANLDLGVNDEGTWPRLVQLCGRVVRMTQDQWDIHKLDPEYECVVHAPPEITRINRRLVPANDIPQQQEQEREQEHLPGFAHDTSIYDTPAGKTVKMEGTTPTPKVRHETPSGSGPATSNNNNDGDDLGFESPSRMSVDNDADIHHPHFYFMPNQTTPKAPSQKRPRWGSFFAGEAEPSRNTGANPRASVRSSSGSSDTEMGPNKRTRVHDPSAARRKLQIRKAGRVKKRKAELDARLKARQNALQNIFWEELGVPPELRDPTFFSDSTDPDPEPHAGGAPESEDLTTSGKTTPAEEEEDEEAIRQAQIEESRRKLAELEKDKPLWEEAARERKERELREEEERKKAEIVREEKKRQKVAFRRYREQWVLEQQAHEQEMRKRQKGTQMFVASAPTTISKGIIHNRWSAKSALERCIQTAARFDSANYTPNNPLKFQSIPWPMLAASFTINDIEWAAVETFFKTIKVLIPPKDFKELVEKSHKRFHPDRWRSRRILASVEDDLERDLLEVAGSTVAQALTPLWKKVTGRE